MSTPLFTPPVAERLPNEPDRSRPPPPVFALRLLLRAAQMGLLLLLTLPLWPLYALSALVWGWAPNVPRAWQVRRYLGLVITTRPPQPGLPALPRAWLALSILRKVAVTPLWGLAWQLDELLYGRALRDTPLVAPLIEIAGARSGSTQLARYLEDDPELAATPLLCFVFPYLWLWRLAPHTLGRVFTREWVLHQMERTMPPEFLERHEADPFRTDTFEGSLYLGHLNHLAPFFGPQVLIEDFAFGSRTPHNRPLWERDFVNMLDRIGRKTLLYVGPAPDGRPRRYFVKGHFLPAAEALEARFPDARFLTMIRDPRTRLRSQLNYLRANPVDATLGPVPWAWLGEGLAAGELEYCAREQDWFTRPGARRCVLRFERYTRDLEGSLRRIYTELLDRPGPPAQLPREHPPRRRSGYLLDRTLAQAGVDEAEFTRQIQGYLAWCAEGP